MVKFHKILKILRDSVRFWCGSGDSVRFFRDSVDSVDSASF